MTNQQKLDKLYFPVQLSSTEEITGYAWPDDAQTCVYAPTVEKNGKTGMIMKTCGSDYKLVPNKDLVQPIYESLIEHVGTPNVEVRVRMNDYRRFHVDFILTSLKFKVGNAGEHINPQVTFQNSYDGWIKYGYSTMAYRQICTNGMMGWGLEIQKAAKHNKKNLLPTWDQVYKSIEEMAIIREKYIEMEERMLEPNELEEIFIRIRNDNFRFPKKKMPKVEETLNAEMKMLGSSKPSAYKVYNAYNWVLNNDPGELDANKIIGIDRKLLKHICEVTEIDKPVLVNS